MCGITGCAFADPSRPADPAVLRRMTDTLVHRGPDGEGYYERPGVALGVRRLSIIDLETGDQPITSEDGRVTVVCNGEIYNHLELRRDLESRGHVFRSRSDVEVIVHLYEDVGSNCLEQLRGMFAFALWDDASKMLLLARDRFGIKPLFYAERTGALYFGSEQKAILASGDADRSIGWQGFHDLLSLGFVCAPSTMFESIRQLPPGTALTYSRGRVARWAYWDATFPRRGEEDRTRSESDWADALRETLDESVRIHLRSDVPVGSWLSPGIDSSTVVAMMRRHVAGPICTATLRFEDPAYDEVEGQLTLLDRPELDLRPRTPVCSSADLERFPASIWYGETPSSSGLEVVRDLLGEASARDVKVVLTGEGADEILAGYKKFRLDKLLRPLAWLPSGVRRMLLLGETFPKRWPRASDLLVASRRIRLPRYASMSGRPQPCGVDRVLSDVAKINLAASASSWDFDLPADFDRWHPLSQAQYYEIKTRLPSLVVHTLDRGSMAHSVEARVPFLDHLVFEFVAQMPPSLRLKGLREKHVLREAASPILPAEIVGRRKMGLRTPIGPWFREPLPEFAQSLLSEGALRRAGYFDPAGVAALLEEHRTGRWLWERELTLVLAVQIWDALFVREELDLLGSRCRPS